jgi:hypothetical protein
VEKTTIREKPQKKEVITTSNKEKKKVAPAAKVAPVSGKTVAGAKKGSPKRG